MSRPRREVSSRASIAATFVCAGLYQSTWFSRIPSVALELHLSVDRISLLLFAFALGALVGLAVAPPITARLGTASALRLAVAALERHRARSMMPQFHALYSVGALTGSLVTLGLVAAGVPVVLQFAGAALLVLIVVPVAARGAASAPEQEMRPPEPQVHRLRSVTIELRHPWLLAIGLAVFCVTVVEGTGVNWIAVATSRELGRGQVQGVAALVAFMAATVVSRLVGGPLVDRFGRSRVLRAVSILALVGVELFVFAPALTLVAAALWGLGVALGMPLLISAASSGDGPGAGLRVGSVSAFAYGASFIGPPLVGLVASAIGLLPTVACAGLLLVVTAVFASASATRSPSSQEPASPPPGPHGSRRE